jgi:hypothetical protein
VKAGGDGEFPHTSDTTQDLRTAGVEGKLEKLQGEPLGRCRDIAGIRFSLGNGARR